MSIPNLENWMWAEACDILNQADRLHRHFFRPAFMSLRPTTWEPPVDVYETNFGFKVLIALPGVIPEHLNVMLEDKLLIVDGRRRSPFCPDSHIRRLEIPYGRFERHIELPAANVEIESREFVNGCLLISLRKI